MAKRRRLQGKKLLVATVVLGAGAAFGCDRGVVANLVAPPEDASMDASEQGDGGDPVDANEPVDVMDFPDGPVANLVPPADGSF